MCEGHVQVSGYLAPRSVGLPAWSWSDPTMANRRSASGGAAVLKPAAHWMSVRMSAPPTSCLPLPETETPPEPDEPRHLHEPLEPVIDARIATDAEADASPRTETELPAQVLLLVPPAIRVPHRASPIVSAEAIDDTPREESPADQVAVDDVPAREESDSARRLAREDERETDDRAMDGTSAARGMGADLVMAPRYRLAELKRERRRVADMQEVLESLHMFLTQEAARNRARQRRQRIASAAAVVAGAVLLVGVWTLARHTEDRPTMPTQAGTSGPAGEATCLGAACGTLDVSMFGAAATIDPARSATAPGSPPVLALRDAENGAGDRPASHMTATDARPPSVPPPPIRVAVLETLLPSADRTALAARETADMLSPVDRAEAIDSNRASPPAAARVDSIEVATIEFVEAYATEAAAACADATCPLIWEAPLDTVVASSHGAAALTAALPSSSALVAEEAPDMEPDSADASITDVESVQSLGVRGLVSMRASHQAPLAVALAPPSAPAEDAPQTDADFADVESIRSLAVRGRVAHVEPDSAVTAQPTLPDAEAAAPVAADLAVSSEPPPVLTRALDADPRATPGPARPPRATAPRRRPPSLLQPVIRYSTAKATKAKGPRARARNAQKLAAPAAVIQPRGLFQFDLPKTAPAASAARTTPTSKPLRKGAKAPDSKS